MNVNQIQSQVFSNEVALPKDFNITELYNFNRQNVYIYEKWFIEECFKAGFFNIHKFEMSVLPPDADQRKQRLEVLRLKEYSRENNFVIVALWNLIQLIKQSGFEVLEVGESVPWYVRAYVPALNLMISPSTQSITGILQMLTHKNEKFCIVTYEGYGKDEKTIAYSIESKPPFHNVYEAFLKEKEIEIKKYF